MPALAPDSANLDAIMRASKALAATALIIVTLADVPSAQNAPTVIEAALRALGADSLSSITYSGTAAIGNFGQSRTISFGLASSTHPELYPDH